MQITDSRYQAKWAVALHGAGYPEASARILIPLSRKTGLPLEVRLTVRRLLRRLEEEKGRDWFFSMEPEAYEQAQALGTHDSGER